MKHNLRVDKKYFYKLLRYAAIVGNSMYILWILRNGINEGFRGTLVQVVSDIGLVFLLLLNLLLLYRKKP